METHLVTWTRKTRGANSADGEPSFTNASGFPRTVSCSFQPLSANASQLARGLAKRIDATAYSDTYFDGAVGDLVTFGSVSYVVVLAEPVPAVHGSGYDHVVYGLVKQAT